MVRVGWVLLLRPELLCPECESPLERVGVDYASVAGVVEFENSWVPVVERETIECGRGHRFVAKYEQEERWRKRLVGFGDRLEDRPLV